MQSTAAPRKITVDIRRVLVISSSGFASSTINQRSCVRLPDGTDGYLDVQMSSDRVQPLVEITISTEKGILRKPFTRSGSLDNLVRPEQHSLRNRQIERARSFQVEDKFKLRRLLDR